MAAPGLVVREQYLTTRDGWSLHLRRTLSPFHFDPATFPLLIIPGYGMNSFIFSYHPRGTSMERCLAEGGYEVWSVNLRGQGHSRRVARAAAPLSLRAYAEIDLPAAVARVLAATRTESRHVTLVGCSLGGSIAYGYLALVPDAPVAGLITMGAPLRWVEVHPLLRVAFASPVLAGSLRVSNTRRLVRRAMPLLRRTPSLLSLYMNAASIDLSHLPEMTQTVEDPDPRINRELAEWIQAGDLWLAGRNVTEAMGTVAVPLLVVLSNKDGIVPEGTAMTAAKAWGGRDVEVLRVGTDDNWYAHANLFVADDAPTLVFDPIIRWLRWVKDTRSVFPPPPPAAAR